MNLLGGDSFCFLDPPAESGIERVMRAVEQAVLPLLPDGDLAAHFDALLTIERNAIGIRLEARTPDGERALSRLQESTA